MITDLKNKKIAVLGLGVEGKATLDFLAKKGGKVWILDKRQKSNIDQNLVSQGERLGAHFVCGENYLENLSQFDIIIRSPGVKRLRPELVAAAKAGGEITSQVKLFFDLCPAKIIGVTGTKGKGTTSTLIYEILQAAGKDVYLGGNIGVPPFTFLDKLIGSSWVVLELSSFQLQDLHKSPHIAVMLMVTSEHLDYHETVEEYIDAKRNILRFQTKDDYAILNRDYPATHESDIYTDGKVFQVSRERETDDGCFAFGGKIVIRRNGAAEEIIKITEVALPGKHNLENICAATMAAKLAGVSKATIAQVVKRFTGLEHRLELVSEIKGVKYYNDSFSTIPETAIAAIEAFDAPEILILGGASKKSDFSGLGLAIREAKNIKAIIGIGEEWERIKEHIPTDTKILLVEGAKDMATIVQAASKIAQSGDIVLLSPACTSFDMFKNYKERGELFRQEVAKLGMA